MSFICVVFFVKELIRDKKRIYQEKIKAQLKNVIPKIYQLKAMRDLLRLELQELKEIKEDPGADFEKRIQNSMHELKGTLDISGLKLK